MTSSRFEGLVFSLPLLVGLMGGALPAGAAEWPAITAEEKALTSVPQQPDAPAIVLDREENTDDTKNFRTVYVRIKVLTEAGRKYADVEIPVGRGPFTISQLSGRTVHADGQVIGLEDQPVDKVVVHEHGVRVHVKAFTLPSAQVGSILDYRYSLHFPEGSHNAPEWMVQNGLFEKKAVFKFIPTKYQSEDNSFRKPDSMTMTNGTASVSLDGANNYERNGSSIGSDTSEYACVPHLPAGKQVEEHETQQGLYQWLELDMDSIPAPIVEPHMPPDSAMSWRVACFYRNTSKVEDYWTRIGKAWDKSVEKFLDQKGGIAEAVNQLVAPNDTPEAKVRKIYAAISQMENQSFAPAPAQVPAPNAGAQDVLQKHSGTHDDLNRLFVAMVRAAGVPAVIIWVPDRGRTVFDANFMSTDQLDAEVAVVQLAGQDVFLDPGTKFCPYGVLNWHYAGARGLRQGGNGSATLADSPAPTYKQAVIQRVARLQLTEKGAMDGTLAVGFSGEEAMVRRQKGLAMDAQGRTRLLEDEVRTWLPSGSEVTLTNAPEWDKTDDMLVAKFKVAGPLAVNNGQRWTVPLHIFEANERPLFPLAERTNSVFFDYASRQIDDVHIVLPANVEVETLPSKQQAKTGYAIYSSEQKREGANGIALTRDLAVNSVLFTPAEYKELKDFYDKVAAADSEPAALKGSLQAQRN